MKRTLSILLVALLLLFALPTFAAEGELQPGLYVSQNGTEVLYLDQTGGGVLNIDSDGQFFANGLSYDGSKLVIERTDTPFGVQGDMLVFTFDGAVRVLYYQGAGESYALGDGHGTAFAGSYLAADGKKLSLTADGRGVYTDAAGDQAVLWGSMAPYWSTSPDLRDGTCFILFGSFLTGLTFDGDTAAVDTESEGTVRFARQAAAPVAAADQLYYGYKMTSDGQTYDVASFLKALGMDPKSINLLLRADGTGAMQFMDDEVVELTWVEGTLFVDGESASFTRQGTHIILTVEDESVEFVPAEEPVSLVGTWVFSRAKVGELEIPASMIDMGITIVLDADGTATFISNEGTSTLKWTQKEDGGVALTVLGNEILSLDFDGTELSTYEQDSGSTLIFEKTN